MQRASLRRYRPFVAKSVSLSRRIRRKSIDKQKNFIICICPQQHTLARVRAYQRATATALSLSLCVCSGRASVSACSAHLVVVSCDRRCRTDSTRYIAINIEVSPHCTYWHTGDRMKLKTFALFINTSIADTHTHTHANASATTKTVEPFVRSFVRHTNTTANLLI